MQSYQTPHIYAHTLHTSTHLPTRTQPQHNTTHPHSGRVQRHVVQAAAGDRQMVGDALDGPRPSSYEPPVVDNVQLTDAWELDCYSRPVVGRDGKKLWELLVCDSSGAFRWWWCRCRCRCW